MTNSPWQVRASILIFTSIFVLMQVGYFFQPESNYSPEITSILFGFICFHITGLVIILIILKIQVPAGQRLKELNLPTDHSLLILRQAVVSTVLIIPVIEGILILNLQLMKWLGWTVTENQIGFWLGNSRSWGYNHPSGRGGIPRPCGRGAHISISAA